MQRGALTAFVASHVELSQPVMAEAQRLQPLAKKAHLKTTTRSIEQVIYRLRKSPTPPMAGSGNGTAPAVTTLRAELVRSDDILQDLAKAREMLSGLQGHAQTALDVLARLEAETQRRSEHLRRFMSEWL